MKKKFGFKLLEFALVILFCILIWIVGDDIQIKSWTPLIQPQSRLLFIAVVVGCWFLKGMINTFITKRAEKKLAIAFLEYALQKMKNTDPEAIKKFKAQIKQLIQDLKNWQVFSGKKKISLQKLPWFLVLGTPNSGKTALLEHAGLNFSLLSYRSEPNTKKDFEIPWFASEHAVFLKYSRIQPDAEWDQANNQEAWHLILKTLKQYKKGPAINGIIVTVNIVEFIKNSVEGRQKQIDSLRHYIRDLYELVKARFPLYLVLTQCDQIAGFLEYFGHTSLEEREQAIGFTLPESVGEDKINANLHEQYDTFVEQLRSKLLKLLEQQPDPSIKDALCFFPEQMALLKALLIEGILSVFIPNKLYEIVDFRGVYFTSAAPKNEGAFDPIGQLLAQKFNMPLNYRRHLAQTTAFFVKKLFQEVIIPEAFLIENNRSKYLLKDWIQYLFYAVAMGSMLFGSLALIGGYLYNKNRAVEAAHYLEQLQSRLSQHMASSLKGTLPNWDLLRGAWETYRLDPHHWLLSYQIYQSPLLEENLKKMLQTTLAAEFLPQLSESLEALLKKDGFGVELKKAIFKGYLVLKYPNRLPKAWLANAATESWDENILLTPAEKSSLKNHLNFMLENGFYSLHLNENLIHRITQELFKKPLAFWVYQALNEQIKADTKTVNILALINKEGLFEEQAPSNLSEYYTQIGVASLYTPRVLSLSETMQHEDELIAVVLNEPFENSSAAETIQVVNQWYTHDYLENWQQVLVNLKLKPYTTLEEAVRGFTVLSSADSPLHQLFKLMDSNIQAALALNKNTSLGNPLKDFYLFLKADNRAKAINPERLFKFLEEVAKCLTTLKESNDILRASYEETQDALKPGALTAINELMRAASQLPEPLQGWIKAIGSSAWEVLLKNTNQYLNERWQKEVMVPYQKIRGYFPLEGQGEVDASLKSFSEFFGKAGVLRTFVRAYLEGYLDQSHDSWQWKSLYGYCMSDSAVAAKELQRIMEIGQQFYHEAEKGFLIRFWLTPQVLSPNTASVHLKIGKEEIVYRHGPQSTFKFNWQPSTQVERVVVSFINFEGKNISRSFEGEWSLLKLMEWGTITKEVGADSYRLHLELEGYEAEFLLRVEGSEAFEVLLEGIEVPDYF